MLEVQTMYKELLSKSTLMLEVQTLKQLLSKDIPTLEVQTVAF